MRDSASQSVSFSRSSRGSLSRFPQWESFASYAMHTQSRSCFHSPRPELVILSSFPGLPSRFLPGVRALRRAVLMPFLNRSAPPRRRQQRRRHVSAATQLSAAPRSVLQQTRPTISCSGQGMQSDTVTSGARYVGPRLLY